ncbi:DUF4082 domain-containing protein [Amniculibacterium aquaticum]|uniref:DUF4082 domain-containing protein n=1 Tax=Amniculibacterium aquaticum TaxID=2479858 RepID=UPI000F5AB970|nr:DUF4082 domain-containing protein [Amniculibacterium aquaticum]
MKTTLFIYAFMVLGFLSSCRSDDPTPVPVVYPEENSLSGLMTSTGFDQKNTDMGIVGTYFEYGMVFSPSYNGVLKSFVINIPKAESNVRITLWDTTTMTVVHSLTIASVAANTTTYATPSGPIALAKDKKYTLTMNTYSYHYRERNDGASITYPIAVGSIVYHNYVWDSGSAQVYPASTANFYYAGDLSFIYQRTN